MWRSKYLMVGGGCLVLGFLAGRVRQRSGSEAAPAPAPAGIRDADRATAGAAETATRSSYADLERRFATMSGLRRSAAISGAVGRMDLAKVKQLLAEAAGGETNYYFFDYREANLRHSLFQRWAELDPESLITHAMALHTAERGEGLNYAFSALAQQDYDAATGRLQQLDPDTRDTVKFAMLGALASFDPERAFDTALRSDDAAMRNYLPMVLAKWASSDSARALAAFAALPPGKERQECLNVMAYSMTARDSAAALVWAGQLDNAQEKATAMKAILGKLAHTDPLKALAVLEQNPAAKGSFGDSAFTSIFSNLARLDFGLAKVEVMKLQDPASRAKALAALASVGKQNHADELLALAATLPTAEAKALYLGEYWSYSQDPAKMAAWLEKIPEGPLRQQAKLRALNSLAYQDPEAAAKQLATLQPTMLNYTYPIAEIANNWSRQDPAKALEWANGLESFDQRKQALTKIYANLTDADPAASVARLAEITDPKLRSEITASVVGRWAMLDPTQALAWSRGLPAGERNAAMRQIAGSQIDGNPALARQVFDQMIQQLSPNEWNKSETRDTAGRMAAELAETDPQAAARFADALPASAAQEKAYANVIGAWSRYAPAEAEAWLDQMPVGGIRDQAASTFAATVASSDPAKAYQWAVSIADPALRRDAAAQSLKAWKANGQLEQARSALQQAGVFSEQDLSELRKAIE